jgi:hypothetical protein
MFAYLSSSPRSLPFVPRVPCKKNSAAKNYELEEKKTAYFGRGGSSPFFFNASAPKNPPGQTE